MGIASFIKGNGSTIDDVVAFGNAIRPRISHESFGQLNPFISPKAVFYSSEN
jgi:hypothetical protein